jgi:tRNA pseudouridine32 synthase/23S rRNA pseudouridine746 synthase
MTRAARPAHIPPRGGLDASAVALPGAGPWASVLDFLAWRLPAQSRAAWAARMAAGEVLDEAGQPLPPETPFLRNARIWYYRHVDTEPPLLESETVLFQDDWLVVADKPHHMPVVPGGRYVRSSLLVRLRERLGLPDLSPLHRIDRETAGLVVFAVQPHTRAAYQDLFRLRQVHKVYEALAPWRADLALPRVHRSRLAPVDGFFTMHEVPGEANSETQIEPMEQLGGLARYRLTPLTGKRHQLRAHMHALGLPLLGDRFYPEVLPADLPDDAARPLQLLAQALAFTDPFTGEARQFASRRRLLPLQAWAAIRP